MRVDLAGRALDVEAPAAVRAAAPPGLVRGTWRGDDEAPAEPADEEPADHGARGRQEEQQAEHVGDEAGRQEQRAAEDDERPVEHLARRRTARGDGVVEAPPRRPALGAHQQ